MKRPKPALCARLGCGHSRWRHRGHCTTGWVYSESAGWWTLPDTVECRCEGFLEEPAPTSATRKKAATKRSTKSYASQAERRVAKELGGKRVGNSGHQDADVKVYKNEELMALVEVKQGPHKFIFAAYDQVRAVPSAGCPRRLIAFVEKPGQGRPGRILIAEEIAEWTSWNGLGDAL